MRSLEFLFEAVGLVEDERRGPICLFGNLELQPDVKTTCARAIDAANAELVDDGHGRDPIGMARAKGEAASRRSADEAALGIVVPGEVGRAERHAGGGAPLEEVIAIGAYA